MNIWGLFFCFSIPAFVVGLMANSCINTARKRRRRKN